MIKQVPKEDFEILQNEFFSKHQDKFDFQLTDAFNQYCQTSNLKNNELKLLLKIALDFAFNNQNAKEPYTNCWAVIKEDGTKELRISPNELTPDELQVLYDSLSTIRHPFYISKVADILFTQKFCQQNNYKLAKVAIKNYLQIVENFIQQDLSKTKVYKAQCVSDYLKRALNLAKSIKNQNQVNEIINLLITYKNQYINQLYTGDAPIEFFIQVITLLKSEKQTFSNQEINIAINQANQITNNNSAECLLKAIKDSMCSQKEQKVNITKILVNFYITQAQNSSSNSSSQSLHFYEEAYNSYKDLPKELKNPDQEKELYNKIKQLNQDFAKSLKPQSYRTYIPIDEDILNNITKNDFKSAMLQFPYCSLLSLPSKEIVKKQPPLPVIDEIPNQIHFNSYSEPIKIKDNNLLHNNILNSQNTLKPIERKDDSLLHSQYILINSCINLKADFIRYILHNIKSKYSFTTQDILPLIQYNKSFINPQNADFIATGVYHFLNNNMIEATSILIPQFEQMLRHCLDLKGIKTGYIKDKGTMQSKIDLKELLDECQKCNVLRETSVFYLKLLLTDERFNLRNNLAHGKFTTKLAYSSCSYVLLFLIYSIIINPIAIKDI